MQLSTKAFLGDSPVFELFEDAFCLCHGQHIIMIDDTVNHDKRLSQSAIFSYTHGMEFHERLMAAREALKWSQGHLGKEVGAAQSTVATWEKGKNEPDLATIMRLAAKLKTTPEWLAFGRSSELSSGETLPTLTAGDIFEVKGEEFARIPAFDVQFSAGFGANNDTEQVLDYQVMSVATLRRWTDAPIRQLSFIRVDGDSMEPLLLNGDWVLIDASNTNLISPAVYAIVYAGRGFLKHASQNIETKAVTLVSHNPAYPPQTITRPEGLRIIGRVVLSIRKH